MAFVPPPTLMATAREHWRMSETSCIFCQIVAGDVPSRTVHETDAAVAFLDVNPLAEGHTVVIPRDHRRRLQDLSAAESTGLWSAVQSVLPAVEAAVGADATTVGVNDGPASGQEIPHVHVHVIPRFQGDGGGPIHAVAGRRPSPSDDELDEIAASIADEL